MNKSLSKGHSKAQAIVDNISLQSVAQGASKFWKSVVAGASHMLTFSALTDSAEAFLCELSDDLSATFDDKNDGHIQILKKVWTALFFQKPFERNSVAWKTAGFQSALIYMI